MAHVIELHPKSIQVPTFDASEFSAALRDLMTVPAIDPHILGNGELLEVTMSHRSTCACSFCEEIALRQMEGAI